MTQRLKGLTVAFEQDIREDDAEALINAIRMIRGVASVTPIEADSGDWINRQRVRHEIAEEFGKLWNFITTGKKQ